MKTQTKKQFVNIDMVADKDLILRVIDVFDASPITVIAKGTTFNGKPVGKFQTIENIKRKLEALNEPFVTSEIVLLYEALSLYLNLYAETEGTLKHAERLFFACESSLDKQGLIG